MMKAKHPLKQWIKENGLKISFVAEALGAHPRTLGRYMREGKAPLLFRHAVAHYTGGAVGLEAWSDAE